MSASALNTLNGKVPGTLTVTNVVTLTGTAADIATAASADNAGTLALASNFGATATGAADATDLTTIYGQTSATINATGVTGINGSAANVHTVIDHAQVNHDTNFTVTISGTSAAAADLKAINTITSGIITATGVETITGSLTDVGDVVDVDTNKGNAGQQIDIDTDFNVTLSDVV